MKRVLVFARDPGGENVMESMLDEIQEDYEVVLYGKDVALDRFCKAGYSPRNIMADIKEVSVEELKAFLKSIQVALILTGTSADDYVEKYLWKAAGELGIPSMAVLDQWLNYGIRFSRYSVHELEQYQKQPLHEYLPDCICVMDSYAKEKLMEEGVRASHIAVTGQPYLCRFVDMVKSIPSVTIKNYRQQYAVNKDVMLLFASEPICKVYGDSYEYFGYNEVTIFTLFSKCLNRIAEKTGRSVSVVVRPHPKEDEEQWKNRFANSEWVSYYVDRKADNKVAMAAADGVVGMSSMFLLESTLCGKPILSILAGLKPGFENEFILEKLGVTRSAMSEREVENRILTLLLGKDSAGVWDIPMDATMQIKSWMNRLLHQR